jgi:aspartate ammonia-lyase
VVNQVCFQVIGHDVAVTMAAEAGAVLRTIIRLTSNRQTVENEHSTDVKSTNRLRAPHKHLPCRQVML